MKHRGATSTVREDEYGLFDLLRGPIGEGEVVDLPSALEERAQPDKACTLASPG